MKTKPTTRILQLILLAAICACWFAIGYFYRGTADDTALEAHRLNMERRFREVEQQSRQSSRISASRRLERITGPEVLKLADELQHGGQRSSDAAPRLWEIAEPAILRLKKSTSTDDVERLLEGLDAKIIDAAKALAFGNVRSHRYVYMFQAYVWPKHDIGRIYPPEGYTGTWRIWYANGQKWEEGNYKDGKRHGKWLGWFREGQKLWKGNYKDGKRHGKYLTWHANGQRRFEANFKNGKLTRTEAINEKGDVILSGSYKDGKPFEGSFYDRDEKREDCIKHYKNGKLIRTEYPDQKKQPEATK